MTLIFDFFVQLGRVNVAKFILSCLRKSFSLADLQKDMNEALLCAVNICNEELCDFLIESGAQIVSTLF